MINAAREMKEFPDLSALIKKKLSRAKRTPYATPGETTPFGPPSLVVPPESSVGPVNIESSREKLVQSSDRETAKPSVTDDNKKKRPAPGSSASIEARTRTESDEPPSKKKKKEKKKRKKSVEEQSEPIGDVEGHDGSSREGAAQADVELNDSPNVPLERRKRPSREQDAPVSAARTPLVTRDSGSASEERRVKFPDRVEFKYDGYTPLAYAPSECA